MLVDVRLTFDSKLLLHLLRLLAIKVLHILKAMWTRGRTSSRFSASSGLNAFDMLAI
jgi:hypothetical protein